MRLHYLFTIAFVIGGLTRLSVSSCTEGAHLFEQHTEFTRDLTYLFQRTTVLYDYVDENVGNQVLKGKQRKTVTDKVQRILEEWESLLSKAPEQKFEKNDASAAKEYFMGILDELSFATGEGSGRLYKLDLFSDKEKRTKIKETFDSIISERPVS